jgi:hypothetical protein
MKYILEKKQLTEMGCGSSSHAKPPSKRISFKANKGANLSAFENHNLSTQLNLEQKI